MAASAKKVAEGVAIAVSKALTLIPIKNDAKAAADQMEAKTKIDLFAAETAATDALKEAKETMAVAEKTEQEAKLASKKAAAAEAALKVAEAAAALAKEASDEASASAAKSFDEAQAAALRIATKANAIEDGLASKAVEKVALERAEIDLEVEAETELADTANKTIEKALANAEKLTLKKAEMETEAQEAAIKVPEAAKQSVEEEIDQSSEIKIN